jgi:hypothetical protein
MIKCKHCNEDAVVRYKWYNGICNVQFDYCKKHEKDNAPPKRQFKINGGVVIKLKDRT